MNKGKVLLALTLCYSIIACGSLVWTAKAWASTNPAISIDTGQVKGISTEYLQPLLSSSTDLDLTPYPDFSPADFPKIYAGEYTLYNPESGKVLVQSSSETPVAIASTTKLMTTHLVAKIGNLDDVITISDSAVNRPIDSSLMGIHAGETMTVRNLLYGALLVSGNDAAEALAEYAGGILLKNPYASSTEKVVRFVTEMNAEANRLKMVDTHYVDAIGYDDNGRSSALDIAKLTSVDLEQKDLTTIMTTAEKTVYDQTGTFRYDLRNSDRMVTDYSYAGMLAGKTGFTLKAGHCLATAARRNGITLVAVILHTDSNTNEASAIENRKLLDAGFNLIHWK